MIGALRIPHFNFGEITVTYVDGPICATVILGIAVTVYSFTIISTVILHSVI